MSSKTYFAVSAIIFGLVAALHLVRAIKGLSFEIGTFVVPIWVSWVGAIVAAVLCAFGVRLASK